ncbi:hypothetical protein NCC49_002361 [Naganishia albida]|nr:hypothetical protein NCC49_002361 [Naganishia albida]
MNQPTGDLIGTPTAELGAFEYPFDAVSPTIRRLVADEPPVGGGLVPPGFSPCLRRTSSTSTVPVVPAGGRRPSVVHSNTVPQAEAGRRFSLATGDGEGMGPHSATAMVGAVEAEEAALREEEGDVLGERRRSSAISSSSVGRQSSALFHGTTTSPIAQSSGRRPSILAFAHQPLPETPVPPSLAHLGGSLRRGSIPANQLFPVNMPPRDRQSSISSLVSSRSSISSASGSTATVVRSSLSGPVFTNQGTNQEQMTVSSAYLYQRRSSLASTSRGLLSSHAPPLGMIRPGAAAQQRTGSMSSTTSSIPSSSGSRESVTTIRDLRSSFSEHDRRPSLTRQGDSGESTATERPSRRMSMPALPSPSPGLEDAAAPEWLPSPRTSGFHFPPQVSTGQRPIKPFTLAQPPSPRLTADPLRVDSDVISDSSTSSKDAFDRGSSVASPATINSSSDDLSDTSAGPIETPSRRTFRISQRGIQARERRRSSRMSALATASGGNPLETIPSDNVVDFSRSARSSFSSGGMPTTPGVGTGSAKSLAGVNVALGDTTPGSRPTSASSTPSSAVNSMDELVAGKAQQENAEEEGAAAITTSFRAFAFPPRNGSIGSVQEGK